MQPTRDDAWRLLNEFTTNPSLIKHGLSVAAAMRAYARLFLSGQIKRFLV